MKKKAAIALLVASAIATLTASAWSQPQINPCPVPSAASQCLFVYSVKYLCGLQVQDPNSFKPSAEPPVKPGNYATAVNIHNFNDVNVPLCKKAVVALPERSPSRGQIGPFIGERLKPDEAFEVDCTDIVSLFPAGTALAPFIKGFVEIRSPVALSVTAVYTAQACDNGDPRRPCFSPFTSSGGPISRANTFRDIALEVVPQTPFFICPSQTN